MISRRFFMVAGGVTVSIPAAFAQSDKYHFTLGVASGCPRPDGIVLWTRLAPEPLRGGGMPPGKAGVRWRLCSDQAMRKTVREGIAETSDAKAHSVHVVLRTTTGINFTSARMKALSAGRARPMSRAQRRRSP
jgi:alkaline phosphatase D